MSTHIAGGGGVAEQICVGVYMPLGLIVLEIRQCWRVDAWLHTCTPACMYTSCLHDSYDHMYVVN